MRFRTAPARHHPPRPCSAASKQLAEETGLPPEQTAEIVLDAIKEERFYVLTHDGFDGVIRERMENILNRRNPEPKGAGLTSTRTRDVPS